MRERFNWIGIKPGVLTALLSVILQMALPTLHVLHESQNIISEVQDAGIEQAGMLSSSPKWRGSTHHPHDQDHCSLCQAFCHPPSTWSAEVSNPLGFENSVPMPGGRTAVAPLALPIGFSKARGPPSFS